MLASGPQWEHFPHGADIGVRGIGATREEAFEQAALAVTAVVTDPERVRCRERVPLEGSGLDDVTRLVDWLNSVIYAMSTRRMLFRRFGIEFGPGGRWRGWAEGERVEPERHQPAVEVKGATFSCAEVKRLEPGGWMAQCVVDV